MKFNQHDPTSGLLPIIVDIKTEIYQFFLLTKDEQSDRINETRTTEVRKVTNNMLMFA